MFHQIKATSMRILVTKLMFIFGFCIISSKFAQTQINPMDLYIYIYIYMSSICHHGAGRRCMLQSGVVPYTSWICCCAPLITTKRTSTEGRPVFCQAWRAVLRAGDLPVLLKFLTIGFHRSQDDFTLHLLGFTWVFTILSPPTSSQVVYKGPFFVKETLPLCLWVNEPCSSYNKSVIISF